MLIGDDNPRRRIARPWACWGLAAALVGAFAAQLGGPELERLLLFDPALLRARPTDPAVLLTLLGHAFLHGGLLHLAGNLVALLVFGDNIEDAFGPLRFLVIFAACALAGALLHAAIDTVPLAGASGGIAGLMGAYLLIWPRAKLYLLAFGRLPVLVPASWFVGFWIAMNIVSAALDPLGEEGVAWFAHIGGFAMGMVLALTLRPADVALFQPAAPATAQGWSWFRRLAWDFAPAPATGTQGTPDEKPAAFGKAVLFVVLLLSLALV